MSAKPDDWIQRLYESDRIHCLAAALHRAGDA